MSSDLEDIRVVVSVDFGTTFSGYSIVHVNTPDSIKTNNHWPNGPRRETGMYKVPTLLEYDQAGRLKAWGLSTFQPTKRGSKANTETTKVVELFKLHLSEKEQIEKLPLPAGIDHKRAITDFLRELGKEIKESVKTAWPDLMYPQAVRFVVTIPVEWSPRAQQTMRCCCFDAGLMDRLDSENLQFTTEPEAAALRCRELIDQYNLRTGDTFMIVDCGGGTVDLTTRTILKDQKLSQEIESVGACCGGSYVDTEFINWISRNLKLSHKDAKNLRQSPQCRLSIRKFFWPLKNGFDGNNYDEEIVIDLEREFKFLRKMISTEPAYEDIKEAFEDEDWSLYLDFDSFKAMFDPSVEEIIKLIRNQLDNCKTTCKAIFMVGGYSESKYLQHRVKAAFERRVTTIAVPETPVIAVLKGGALYGLGIDNETGMSKDIHDRVLKYTFGTDILTDWKECYPAEKEKNGKIKLFSPIARRGERIELLSEFSENYYPVFFAQRFMKLDVYYTSDDDAKYVDDVTLLREWKVKLPELSRGALDRSITMKLLFGHKEVKAQATSVHLDKPLEVEFEYPE